MSSINYAETLLAAADRRVGSASEIRALFSASGVEIASVTAQLAEIAAQARIAFPLNLGDCFAYALAKQQDFPLLTLDRDF
jgi:ribonuclease VapC